MICQAMPDLSGQDRASQRSQSWSVLERLGVFLTACIQSPTETSKQLSHLMTTFNLGLEISASQDSVKPLCHE